MINDTQNHQYFSADTLKYKGQKLNATTITKEGNGDFASQGQIVTVDIALSANTGEIMRPPGSPIPFPLGTGEIISIIETNVQKMTIGEERTCLLYTSPSPRDGLLSRMPSSA